jgi:TonB-linked SusC/RagA family outer membrane protein
MKNPELMGKISWIIFSRKMFLIMKLSFLLLLIGFLQLSATSYSQGKLTVSLENVSIKDVLHEIEEQSDFRFLYRNESVADKRLSLNKENSSIEEILDETLKGTNANYLMLDHNLIVITPHNQVQKQELTVEGQITDDNGNPLPGVNILIEGTTTGVVTDLDGNYTITVPSEDAILVVSFVGFITQEIPVNGRSEINIQLQQDTIGLEEVVVTGVVDGTPKTKLGFTVDKVSDESLQEVPSPNAAASLNGKVAGIKVSQNNGSPGENPDIQLRSATTIFGSSNPLIIVDGVLTEGGLSDINVEDIASIEVVKGAAASSLYGSRAANGVVNITTKRGTGLESGTSQVTYRTELGQSYIPFIPEKTTAINVEVENGEVNYDNPSPDGVYDNKYPSTTDPVGQFFDPGFYMTHYLSFRGNGNEGKTALFSSLQFTDEGGVVNLADGRERINFRVNLDHRVTDKLKVAASNLYSQSSIDNRANGIWDMFYYADPDVDLLEPNEEDGSKYNVNPNRLNPRLPNPLYSIHNTLSDEDRNRFIGHYRIEYDLLSNLELTAAYGLDRIESSSFSLSPKGLLQADRIDLTNGSIAESSSNTTAQTLEAQAFFYQQIGDLNTKFKLQYLYESNDFTWFNGSGTHLAVLGKDVRSLDQASENLNINSIRETVVANNYSAVLFLDWQDKYIFDALVRRDGVSLFGEEERWQTFYRASAAWRLTEDVLIPGFQEFKIRASYGIAGLRPIYSAQYEVVYLSDGTANPGGGQKGNPNLKNSFSKELELGLDAEFLDRISLTFSYANSINTDQILEVPISATTGYVTQWQNAGRLSADVWEASLGANLIRTNNLSWDLNFIWDRITQKVDELNRSGYSIVSGGIFRIEEDVEFGTFYGRKWATKLEDVESQLPDGYELDEYYTINNQGYVVRTEHIGTTMEEPIQIRDEDGNFVEDIIGSVIPDFNANLSSNLRWRNLNFYLLMGYQQGGQTYNHMRRYMMINGVGATLDQSDNARNEIKSNRYYDRLTTWNNEYFVEDASYLKLRELSLGYTFGPQILDNTLGISNIKISLIGRNLYTLTNYSGFDPETGKSEEGLDSNILKFDLSSYPNYATISGSIQVTF